MAAISEMNGISYPSSRLIGDEFAIINKEHELTELPEGHLYAVVEIPKGSRNKYEWDSQLNAIKLDRFLYSSVVYPLDYGFIPESIGEDGDPLDVMVLVSEPTFPGCWIEVKPIALFKMHDDKGSDDKVICVPVTDPNWNTFESLNDVTQQLQDEISHFFAIYKNLEKKHVEVEGWFPVMDAWKVIEEAHQRYKDEEERR